MFRKLIILNLLILILGCNKNELPESYGYFAVSDKTMLPVKAQKVNFAGNISSCITGIKGTSGTQAESVKYFIVYEKGINIKSVSVARLNFKQSGMVENIMGPTPVEVNLWAVSEKIDVEVSPVDKKPDMYKLTPKSPLIPGFYAIHTGALSTTSTIDAVSDRDRGSSVYDIVIGQSMDKYKSAESKSQEKSASIASDAKNLLNSFNSYFNAMDCNNLKEIYMPDGKALAGNELKEYCSGISSWLSKSGKITKSEIVGSDITGDSGTFSVNTTYEKTGVQNERFVMSKIGGNYKIVSFQ